MRFRDEEDGAFLNKLERAWGCWVEQEAKVATVVRTALPYSDTWPLPRFLGEVMGTTRSNLSSHIRSPLKVKKCYAHFCV